VPERHRRTHIQMGGRTDKRDTACGI